MNQHPGQQVGAYELVRLLETGEVVESYVGEHVRTRARATIKLFCAPITEEGAFQQKARQCASVAHLQVVRILDFSVHEKRPFLVGEYFPDSLRQFYPAGAQLPPPVVMHYVQQVGAALHSAHEQGIVHGALRPECLLLKPQDRSILLDDLGIITLERTLTPTSRYTSPYMAPEQEQGELLPASDQYALAKVIYEWLSGERAALEMPPSSQGPALPTMIEAVLRMALESDPRRRFRSIQAFVTALGQASQSDGTPPAHPIQMSQHHAPQPVQSSIPVGPDLVPLTLPSPAPAQAVSGPLPGQRAPRLDGEMPQPPQLSPPLPDQPLNDAAARRDHVSRQQSSPVSRRTLLAGLGIVAGGLVIAGAGIAVARSSRAGSGTAPDLNPSDPIYIYRGYESHPQNIDSTPLISSVEWSPDSTRVISIVSDNNADQIRIWNAADGGNAFNYTGAVGASVGWVGNLPYVAFSDDQNVAHVQELPSGKNVALHVNVATISWSPDSRMIASVSHDSQTFRVWNPMNGQGIATLTTPPSSDFAGGPNLLWAPDNTQLLGWDDKGRVYVWDAHSGTLISRYHQLSDEYFAANPTDDVVLIEPLAWSPDSQYIAATVAAPSNKGASNASNIHVWTAKDGQTVSVYTGHTAQGETANIFQLAWSPTSKLLASSVDRDIQIWDATSGAQIHTYSQPYSRFAWSPLAERLAIQGTASGITISDSSPSQVFQVCDARNGEHGITYTYPAGQNFDPDKLVWSPNGQFIMALDGSGSDDIAIWRAREK